MTRSNLKEKLIQRTFSQSATLKSVFDEWRLPAENYVQYERFAELMNFWGFIAPETEVRNLYNWLDQDKDGQLSFEDLRETIGLDVSPQEGVYFRQNIKNSKSQPCHFPSCWENTLYNNRSAYCPLHQKIMKNSTIDLFNQISTKMPQ